MCIWSEYCCVLNVGGIGSHLLLGKHGSFMFPFQTRLISGMDLTSYHGRSETLTQMKGTEGRCCCTILRLQGSPGWWQWGLFPAEVCCMPSDMTNMRFTASFKDHTKSATRVLHCKGGGKSRGPPPTELWIETSMMGKLEACHFWHYITASSPVLQLQILTKWPSK